jgi:hypothetical protein
LMASCMFTNAGYKSIYYKNLFVSWKDRSYARVILSLWQWLDSKESPKD